MANKPIGSPLRRTDALAKASGSERYLADMTFEGMLFARMVRSGIPRGKITALKLPHLPQGYRFITYRDIPAGERTNW
jgi:CO/xanthine dehydrogenase Mo-binding subunit